ncbi:tyrosine-type recombinase/integrase [Chloroflexota bacterium]
MTQSQNIHLPVPATALKLNKTDKVLAIRRAEAGAADYVVHLTLNEIRQLASAAGQNRHGERDKLLIQLLFDGCFRCSEAIGLCPNALTQDHAGWTAKVLGKGSKMAKVAISPSLATQLQAYAYRYKLEDTDRFFPITRSQAFRIVTTAFDKAGLSRPRREIDRVGTVHILRHSGSIERLRQTGNPKAVQDHLRHKSALMTLRYLKTVSVDESLRVQQEIDFKW